MMHKTQLITSEVRSDSGENIKISLINSPFLPAFAANVQNVEYDQLKMWRISLS
jgi:hypothetical protein